MPEPAIPAPLRPDLLTVSSVLFIVACLGIAGFGLALLLQRPDPCSAASGALLVGWPLWLAQLEYRGTFRLEHPAARLVNFWWLGLMIFQAVQLPAGTLVSLQDKHRWSTAYFVGAILLLIFTGAGYLLRRDWVRQLWIATKRGMEPNSFKFSMREMMMLIAAAAVMLGTSSACLRFWSAGFAEHVSRERCPFEVPVGAKDVSYYDAWPAHRAYEFSIDEKGFEAWAASLELYEMRLPQGTYEMPRYGRMHPTLSRNNYVEITKGWYAQGEVHGRLTLVAYDSETNWAYYYCP